MAELLFDEQYADNSVRFTVTLDSDLVFRVAFHGKGTNPGTDAFVDKMTRCVDIARSRGGKLKGSIDLSELRGAPMRAQLTLTRWIVGVRDALGRFAIVGSGRVERAIAKAVAKAARADNVLFTEDAAEAERFITA